MMETKFTKGEWRVEPSEHAGVINVSFGDFLGGVECWYHHGHTMTEEEAEANAKLIAAAPELLEFAVEMARMYPNSPWISEHANKLIKSATE